MEVDLYRVEFGDDEDPQSILDDQVNGRRNLQYNFNVHNSGNIRYYHRFYFNAKNIYFFYYLDTSSSWFWTASRHCPTNQCTRNRYDERATGSFKNIGWDRTYRYDGYWVRGWVGREKLCFWYRHKCSSNDGDFKFLRVFRAGGITHWIPDGVVGMAPKVIDEGELYMTEMYN